MTLATVNERVLKRRTSPDCWDGGGVAVDGPAVPGSAVLGDGTGDGYARYEFSADGESAQIAVRNELMRILELTVRTFGICGCLNYMHKTHIRNVVDVYLIFQHDDERLAV